MSDDALGEGSPRGWLQDREPIGVSGGFHCLTRTVFLKRYRNTGTREELR